MCEQKAIIRHYLHAFKIQVRIIYLKIKNNLIMVNYKDPNPVIGDLSLPVQKNKNLFFWSKLNSFKISHSHLFQI